MPLPDVAPWDVAPHWPASVHLFLAVHRVTGVSPGLYVLVRDLKQLADLRSRVQEKFTWTQPDGVPPSLPLYLLTRGDATSLAQRISCDQDIAAHGAFAVSLVSRMDSVIRDQPWVYRRLFWETGMVGQVLYLEAEAHGIRSTGMGCYFDDPALSVFFKDNKSHEFQPLYHFTVGGHAEDTRLRTLEAYRAVRSHAKS